MGNNEKESWESLSEEIKDEKPIGYCTGAVWDTNNDKEFDYSDYLSLCDRIDNMKKKMNKLRKRIKKLEQRRYF